MLTAGERIKRWRTDNKTAMIGYWGTECVACHEHNPTRLNIFTLVTRSHNQFPIILYRPPYGESWTNILAHIGPGAGICLCARCYWELEAKYKAGLPSI